MPELPEVEFARRCLDRWARGRRIAAVSAAATRVVRGGPRALRRLVGARVVGVDRRGKNLLVTAQGRAPIGLWSHLGMTGKWLLRRAGDEAPRFSRARLDLESGGSLHYCDMRLFGRLQIVPGADWEAVPELRALGPDPLHDGVDPARFAVGRRPIKLALMDQAVLAGVGNIQASEALFRAQLDPRRPAGTLTAAEARRLAAAIRAAIDDALAQFGTAVGATGEISYVEEGGENPFLVYDRAGACCPRCRRAEIVRFVQGGRSTYSCPRCQR